MISFLVLIGCLFGHNSNNSIKKFDEKRYGFAFNSDFGGKLVSTNLKFVNLNFNSFSPSISIAPPELDCDIPLVGKGRVVDDIGGGLLCILCNSPDVQNLVDGDLSNYVEFDASINLQFATPIVAIRDMSQIITGGRRVGFVVEPVGGLLTPNLLDNFRIRTYLNGSVQEEAIGSSELGVQILGIVGKKQRISFVTSQSFDKVELVLASSLPALSTFRVYYAYHEQSSGCDYHCAEAVVLENGFNPTFNASRSGVLSGLCLFCSLENPEGAITSDTLNTFSSVTRLNFAVGVFTTMGYAFDLDNPVEPGTDIGFGVAYSGISGLLNIGLLDNIEIRTFLGATQQEVVPVSNISQVGVLFGTTDVNLISFNSSMEFDGVQIRISQGVTALDVVRIVFPFVRYDSDGDSVVDCVDKCEGGNDLMDAAGNGIPDDCDIACSVNAGPDLVVCPPDDFIQLTPAGFNQFWSEFAGNPSPAMINNNGQVTGMTEEGIYYFILSEEDCSDTVSISRINSNIDNFCNVALVGPNREIVDSNPFGGVCLFCGQSGIENIVDGDLTNYFQSVGLVGLSTSSYVTVRDNDSIYNSGTRTGYVISIVGGILDLNLLNSLGIRTKLNGVVQQSFIGTPSINATLLPETDNQIRLSIETNLNFNEVEFFQATALGVGYNLRIYYAFTENSASCPNNLGFESCEIQLVFDTRNMADISYENTGIEGFGCANCSISELGNVIDNNTGNYTIIETSIGVGNIVSVSVKNTIDLPAGSIAGYKIGQAAHLLNLNVLNGLRLQTFLNGSMQESKFFNDPTIKISFNGGEETAYVYMLTSEPFNEIRISSLGLVGALNELHLYYSFYAYDSDSDGVLDCYDKCCGGDDGLDENGNGIPDDCEIFPSMVFTKSANPTFYSELEEIITYTILVENNGDSPVSNIIVNDSGATTGPTYESGDTNGNQILDIDEIWVYSATYTVTQNDIEVGFYTNVASLTGTDSHGELIEMEAEETVIGIQNPEIILTKSASPINYDQVGQVITYTFNIVNSGNVTISEIELEETAFSGESPPSITFISSSESSPEGTLIPGEIAIYNAIYLITQSDIDDGFIFNEAMVSGIFNDQTVNHNDDAQIHATQFPEIGFIKEAQSQTYMNVGDSIEYTFIVSNLGNVTLSDVIVSDPLFDLDFGPITLAPQEAHHFTFTYIVDQAALDTGSVYNIAEASTNFNDIEYTAVDDETIYAEYFGSLELFKSASPQSYSVAGEVITYTFSVTNIGNLTLSDVVINDALTNSVNLEISPPTLNPGEVGTATASYVITQMDLNEGNVLNYATVSALDPNGNTVEDVDDEIVIAIQDPSITILKTADSGPFAVGDTITYTITVTNAGNVSLYEVEVNDPLTGLSENIPLMVPGEVVEFTTTYVITQSDMDQGFVYNEATATGLDPNGDPYDDEDEEIVDFDQDPSITILKTADSGPFAVGDTITYTITVTNAGNVSLYEVEVNDPLTGLSENIPLMVPGEVVEFTTTYVITQSDMDQGFVYNEATATGLDPNGDPYDDEDEEIVDFDQDPSISILKTADSGPFAVGDTITYTITVTNTGNVSLYEVEVNDPLTGLSENIPLMVPGEVVEFTTTYVITQSDMDQGFVHNEATATGLDPNGDPYDDEDDEIVDFDQDPSIMLVKVASPQTFNNVGDIINYTFIVTNTGNVTLSNIVVNDSLTNSINVEVNPAILAPGEEGFASATYTITENDLINGSVYNIAYVSGIAPNGEIIIDEDDEVVSCSGNDFGSIIPLDVTFSCSIEIEFEEVEIEDYCGISEIRYSVDTLIGHCANTFELIRTWVVIYHNGTEETFQQVISVVDETPPTFIENLPVDITVSCSDVPVAIELNAIDNCGEVVVEFQEISYETSCSGSYTIERTWTATDECDNSAIHTQQITVNDLASPIIRIEHDFYGNYQSGDTIYLQCESNSPGWTVPVIDQVNDVIIVDNCSDIVRLTYSQDSKGGDCLSDGYLYELYSRWDAMDECGNMSSFELTLIIFDTIQPQLLGVPNDITVGCEAIPVVIDTLPCGKEVPNWEEYVSVRDECECAIIDFEEQRIDGNCSGKYSLLRIWSAMDNCGNIARDTMFIQVSEDSGPVFVTGLIQFEGLESGDIFEVECNDGGLPKWIYDINENHFQAYSSCNGNLLQANFENKFIGYSDCVHNRHMQEYELIWSAVDDCGYSSTFIVKLHLIDTTAPVILNWSNDVCAGAFDEAIYLIEEGCSGWSTEVNEVQVPSLCNPSQFDILRTVEFTDGCNNKSIYEQIVRISDEGPVFEWRKPEYRNLGNGDSITVQCFATNNISGFNPRDMWIYSSCTSIKNKTFHEEEFQTSGDCILDGYLKKIAVRWHAEDECGQQNEFVLYVTVIDTVAPEILSPAFVQLDCGSGLPEIDIKSDCGILDLQVTELQRILNDCPDYLYISREINAVDVCGNESSMIQEIVMQANPDDIFIGLDEIICANNNLIPELPVFKDPCTGETLIPNVLIRDLDAECENEVSFLRTVQLTNSCDVTFEKDQIIVNNEYKNPEIQVFIPNFGIVENGSEFFDECGQDALYFKLDDAKIINSCRGDRLSFQLNEIQTINCDEEGFLHRFEYIWTATDVCGNSSTFYTVVNYSDNVPPVFLTIPNNELIICGEVPEVEILQVWDECDPDVSVIFNEESTIDNGREYIQRFWTAIDACGNMKRIEQHIEIRNDEPMNCDIIVLEPIYCNSDTLEVHAEVHGNVSIKEYFWEVEGGSCEIIGGQGTGTVQLKIGFSDFRISLFVVDTNDCNATCEIELECEFEFGEGQQFLNVYPNPTFDQIFIEVPYFEEEYRLDFYNANGSLVEGLNTNGGTIELNVSKWIPGVYYVKANEKDLKPKRFVKIR